MRLASAAVRLALLGLCLPASAVLPGCEGDAYSENWAYTVRKDPIVLEVLPGERPDPDRPGQLPLLSTEQVQKISLLLGGNTEGVDSKLLDPTRLGEQDRDTIQDTLEGIFGRPAHPYVKLKGTEPLQRFLRVRNKSVEESLAQGSRVYRIQCQQCHGLNGDGRGPTAPWVNPHPRDYRLGKFKFQSVDQAQDNNNNHKPNRDDLVRTVRNGIEGTAMPAFNLLPEDDLQAVVSYVIFLAVRGEAELQTFKALRRDEKSGLLTAKGISGGLRRELKQWVVTVAKQWVSDQAVDRLIQAAPYPKYSDEALVQSVQRGQALFAADLEKLQKLFPTASKEKLSQLKGISCASCHKDYGRQANFKFDEWGTMVRPANLTAGVYRGGRRPIDLYWRIHSGINGSAMNIFGDLLSGEQIWDLVNFVQALPYPRMLKDRYGINIH